MLLQLLYLCSALPQLLLQHPALHAQLVALPPDDDTGLFGPHPLLLHLLTLVLYFLFVQFLLPQPALQLPHLLLQVTVMGLQGLVLALDQLSGLNPTGLHELALLLQLPSMGLALP